MDGDLQLFERLYEYITLHREIYYYLESTGIHLEYVKVTALVVVVLYMSNLDEKNGIKTNSL